MLYLYKTLVRPHLEFWSFVLQCGLHTIGRIEFCLKKFNVVLPIWLIPKLKDMEYKCRLRQLGLWTLEERIQGVYWIVDFEIWFIVWRHHICDVSALQQVRYFAVWAT